MMLTNTQVRVMRQLKWFTPVLKQTLKRTSLLTSIWHGKLVSHFVKSGGYARAHGALAGLFDKWRTQGIISQLLAYRLMVLLLTPLDVSKKRFRRRLLDIPYPVTEKRSIHQAALRFSKGVQMNGDLSFFSRLIDEGTGVPIYQNSKSLAILDQLWYIVVRNRGRIKRKMSFSSRRRIKSLINKKRIYKRLCPGRSLLMPLDYTSLSRTLARKRLFEQVHAFKSTRFYNKFYPFLNFYVSHSWKNAVLFRLNKKIKVSYFKWFLLNKEKKRRALFLDGSRIALAKKLGFGLRRRGQKRYYSWLRTQEIQSRRTKMARRIYPILPVSKVFRFVLKRKKYLDFDFLTAKAGSMQKLNWSWPFHLDDLEIISLKEMRIPNRLGRLFNDLNLGLPIATLKQSSYNKKNSKVVVSEPEVNTKKIPFSHGLFRFRRLNPFFFRRFFPKYFRYILLRTRARFLRTYMLNLASVTSILLKLRFITRSMRTDYYYRQYAKLMRFIFGVMDNYDKEFINNFLKRSNFKKMISSSSRVQYAANKFNKRPVSKLISRKIKKFRVSTKKKWKRSFVLKRRKKRYLQ